MSETVRFIGNAISSAAVLAVVVGGACSSPAEDPKFVLADVPASTPTLTVEVGTGTKDFVALADGDPVDLTFGPQGGFHIWTAVRVRNVNATGVQINLRAKLDDGSLVGPPSRAAASLEAQPDGSAVAAGLRNFVDNASELRGKRVTLTAEVIAADQRHGAGERRGVVR